MGRMIRLLRRNQWWWVAPAVGVMLGLGVWVVLDAMSERDAAFEEVQKSVATERARSDQISDLSDQLTEANDTIEGLRLQVAALVDQVSELGGTPVVVVEEHNHPAPDSTTTTEPEPGREPKGPREPPRRPREPPRGPPEQRWCPLPFLCLGPFFM